jgi:hypothetical protein
LLVLAAAACLSFGAQAQMLSYQKGESYSTTVNESSPIYKIEYRQMLYKGFSTTFDYVNEGHFTGHHPDGYGLQFWYQYRLSEKYRVAIAAGVGPYYYFDTITPAHGQSTDAHGLAPVVTLSTRGKLWKNWDWIVSADSIDPTHDLKAQLLSVGVGYWLSDSPSPAGFFEAGESSASAAKDRNELSIYGVFSVINISGNPNSWGGSAEYRYRFVRHFDGTITYIYEGDPRVARRSGVTAQVWPVRTDVKSGFEIGAGFGAYVFIDKKHPIPGQITTATVAPVVSLMLSHQLKTDWFARAIWDRVVSNYSRDADIWRLGFGRML